ncbi:MAG: response regulator [Bacilli bacterium]|nr:response regulator [Bacilli bacterium]
MIFNFDILGIAILFVLLCIYYSKDIKLTKEIKIFLSMMVTTYLIELLYLGNFVTLKINGTVWLFSKMYLSCLSMFYSLMLCYYITLIIKDKYASKVSVIESKSKSLRNIFIGINIFSIVLIFILDVYPIASTINGSSVMMTYLLWFLYTMDAFIITLVYKKYLRDKHERFLLITAIINVMLIVLSIVFPNINIINMAPIVTLLYMYLTLENIWQKSEEKMEIERDYSVQNNIDKVAFLTNLSHEIRVPLNTIDGFSQVIMESKDLKSVKEDIKDIRLATDDLIEIINGLIDMSAIENGKLELINENYNVKEMFDNIIHIVNSRLKGKKVSFKTNIDKKMPDILLGDQSRIEQVIISILNNSIKYTERGKIEFTVKAIVSANLCRFKITVKDTGMGIRKEDLSDIFEKSDATNKKNIGLSLVVTKELVDLMEGTIDIDSTYGKGTMVTVTIDQKMVEKDKNVKKAKNKDVKPFDAKGKKILIVDDNKLNIKVATKLLEPYNINVTEALSGQECLDILDKYNNFDLILMDDLMPNMSGTETLDVLKKIERVDGFEIPVVVLTANAVTGIRKKYLDKGFDDYLSKPIDRVELDRVLNKFLNKKKS